MQIQMRHFWWLSKSQVAKHISYLEDVHPVMQKEDLDFCVVFHFYEAEWLFWGDFQFVTKALIFSTLVTCTDYNCELFFICLAYEFVKLFNSNCHIPINKKWKEPVFCDASNHDNLSIFCRTFWNKQKIEYVSKSPTVLKIHSKYETKIHFIW